MKNNEKLILERNANGVVQLILNRPEVKNAFDDELIEQLKSTLKSLVKEPVRLLKIQGSGDHFSAGADLNWMQKAQKLRLKDNYKDALKLGKLLRYLAHFPAPVMAVVKGSAYGGALGMIAASDIVVATQSSQFCFSEVKLGLMPATISPYIIRAIGARQAQRYFLTAEQFNAEQAQHMGLVHEIISDTDLEAKVNQLTQQLMQGGPLAQKEIKKLIREIRYKKLGDQLVALTSKRIADIRITDEAKEGLSAFFDKRHPKWR
ncbi:MAG: enoyl-CoA hydratase-related protein [Endozoicomonas sp. (ex Botrylloides leachii)]|nr:enoyl-CoA hydratase-related protein [Endozoicomonas sp. (ex Botrylloides leachii)]